MSNAFSVENYDNINFKSYVYIDQKDNIFQSFKFCYEDWNIIPNWLLEQNISVQYVLIYRFRIVHIL